MNSKNLNIAMAIVLLISIIYGGAIQEKIKDELRNQIILTGEVEYHKGYIQGWEDARKPIEIDTIYYVDTVIVDSFIFENIEDNVGIQLISIPNNTITLNTFEKLHYGTELLGVGDTLK